MARVEHVQQRGDERDQRDQRRSLASSVSPPLGCMCTHTHRHELQLLLSLHMESMHRLELCLQEPSATLR